MIILLIISIFAASFNSVLLHTIPKGSSVFTFNLICCSVWTTALLCINKFSLAITLETAYWGVLYGIMQLLFMLFKTKAMSTGSVSITTQIGNCSLILSTAASVIIWHEQISAIQILGILFLIVSFFLCTYSKSNDQSSKIWILYCTLFFIFAAGIGIMFKCFSKSPAQSNTDDMMITAALTMFIILSVKQFFAKIFATKCVKAKKTKKKKMVFNKKYIVTAVLSGILSCIYNRLNITLAGLFPGAIFYPCFNGGVILISLILSIIFLKERLSTRQTAGLIMGTAAVLAIGLF